MDEKKPYDQVLQMNAEKTNTKYKSLPLSGVYAAAY